MKTDERVFKHAGPGPGGDGIFVVGGYVDNDGEIIFSTQRDMPSSDAWLSVAQVRKLRKHLKRVLREAGAL